jgi:hypothetical protein
MEVKPASLLSAVAGGPFLHSGVALAGAVVILVGVPGRHPAESANNSPTHGRTVILFRGFRATSAASASSRKVPHRRRTYPRRGLG